MPAGPTDKMSVLRLRELLKDCFVQTDAALKIFERKSFVRRMCAAIGQCKSHQQRFDAENFPEFRDDRDASAFADERGVETLLMGLALPDCRAQIGRAHV